MVFSLLLAGFIYPIILAWTWGKGWLYDKGFHDFAGTAIVHLVGGVAGFWGAWMVGERRSKIRNRENAANQAKKPITAEMKLELADPNADYSVLAQKHFKSNDDDLRSTNNVLIVVGLLLTWIGYMFFTGGRTYG